MRAITGLVIGGLAWTLMAWAAWAGTATHPLTRADLGPWLDGVMTQALASNGMAGGEAVVVADGQILYQQGYGMADLAGRKRVDIERTLFRPGSISKLFTWTAVMQQVELGRLDLDADVNRYLDFRLPHPAGRPITLRMLMTHTAGFEERLKGGFAPDVRSLRPLGEQLRRTLPNQLFEPGTTPAYSNWGATLAGYIVQRVSGQPFDDYVEQRIFKPLGMDHSTFRVPPPAPLMAELSSAYLIAPGPAQRFELDQMRPAGSMSATGPDMARFMIAHLRQGRYGSGQILRPETVAMMHATASQPIPPLRGMSLGFFQADRNGHAILTHSGNSQFFFADLSLLPREGVGIYIAFNSAGRQDPLVLADRISEDLADRYFPSAAPAPAEPTAPTAQAHGRLMAGVYESSRRVQSSFVSLVYVLLQQVRVTAGPDGTLVVDNPAFADRAGRPKRWRETGPFVWRQVGGPDRLAARVEGGRVVMFGTDGKASEVVYQPVPLWRSSRWNLPLFAGAFGVLVLTAAAWPAAALIRRLRGRPYGLHGAAAWAQRLAKFSGLVAVAYVVGWAAMFQTMINDLSMMNDGLDPWLRCLQLAGIAVTLGTAAALWNAWLSMSGRRGWLASAGAVVLAAALPDMAWVSFAFRLITPGLDY